MSFGLGADFSVFEGGNESSEPVGEKRKASEAPVVIDEKRLKDEDELELRSLLESLPQIDTAALEVSGCTHEVAHAKNEPMPELKPRTGKAAREYKFTLDPFQEQGSKSLFRIV